MCFNGITIYHLIACYYYISVRGSDAAAAGDGEIEVNDDDDDAMIEKHHTIVNDKDARGMTFTWLIRIAKSTINIFPFHESPPFITARIKLLLYHKNNFACRLLYS